MLIKAKLRSGLFVHEVLKKKRLKHLLVKLLSKINIATNYYKAHK